MKRPGVKRLLLGTVGLVGVLAAVVLIRTFSFTSKQLDAPPADPLKLDEARAVENLRRALRIKTISSEDPAQTPVEALEAFHALLAEAFPKVHAALKKETVSDHALLYEWTGTESKRSPMLLLAHMDVVPANPNNEWEHPPFSGDLADGYIWGRGAIDDKSSVLGILEAVEVLLVEGFGPKRTVYLAFGHDEEVSGANGAAKIAALLASRGVKAEFSHDEGLAVVEGIVPGITQPVALIGTAEKGYASLELTVSCKGGHSSQPPPHTALGILSAAIVKLEEHPLPAAIRGPVREMFDVLGPEMPFFERMAFANLWLFGGLVKRELEATNAAAAALRTTTAVTMMSGGTKDNVLPTRARAVVNFRLMPDDSIDGLLAHVNETIADERIQVRVLGTAQEASPVSDINAPSYTVLNRTIRQIFPGVVVAPCLDIGATDSRHYSNVAQDSYRFTPLWFKEEDLARIHGPNERIAKDDYLRCIRFYAQFIRNAAS